VLAEIAKVAEDRLGAHYLFRNRSRPAYPRLQNLRACFSHWATGAAIQDALAGEEMVLSLVRSAFEDSPPQVQPTASTRRLMRRAKEFLGAELANPIRLRDVGRAAGASPAYLTNTFRRVEGVSLHRYLTLLRLARALAILPQADDLTALALDIGFSSHSHFSAAFRRAFGCTPSQFRQTARGH
jgi:AraC-like DNA-binding protein